MLLFMLKKFKTIESFTIKKLLELKIVKLRQTYISINKR